MPETPRPDAISLVGAAAAALKARVDEVNRLNVFPVPDGDTGTNMSLTMDAVMKELEALPPGAAAAEICHSVTHGSLMGARGNSGVILSQILRGLCEVLGSAEAVDPAAVASALERAVTVAFQAVRKPVEGTMLTVVKDVASAASAPSETPVALVPLLEQLVDAAFESVRRGPDLLPVLKENNVVDAGGFGLAILAEGFVAALAGHDMLVADTFAAEGHELTVIPVDDWDDQEYLYCTEFLIYGEDLDRETVQRWVTASGGSELVVGDADLLKVHVHTNDPASVLAQATAVGQIGEVHINNMRRQTAQRSDLLKAEARPAKPVAFVAVAAGEGLARILTSLGVDVVVSGGQTMNPSTRELVEACERAGGETCIILPNNRNIILTAQQVPGLVESRVDVVPTTAVPQAFAAMLAYDPEAELERNVEEMTRAAGTVRTGEVTTAVKDAVGKAGAITAGQVIGISDHEIEIVGTDVEDVALRLAELLAEDADSATLLAGEDMTDEAVQRLSEALQASHPGLEVESHRGEQPVYPLLMAFE